MSDFGTSGELGTIKFVPGTFIYISEANHGVRGFSGASQASQGAPSTSALSVVSFL